jgi:membrane-bound ClpP family serine protease
MPRPAAHPLSRATIGIPGLAGVVVLLVWLVGWAVLGVHGGAFHLLVAVGLALILTQAVRRVGNGD